MTQPHRLAYARRNQGPTDSEVNYYILLLEPTCSGLLGVSKDVRNNLVVRHREKWRCQARARESVTPHAHLSDKICVDVLNWTVGSQAEDSSS